MFICRFSTHHLIRQLETTTKLKARQIFHTLFHTRITFFLLSFV